MTQILLVEDDLEVGEFIANELGVAGHQCTHKTNGEDALVEARSTTYDVLVIDRFAGGGATARSGGVVYAGGGSTLQKQAGYEDGWFTLAHPLTFTPRFFPPATCWETRSTRARYCSSPSRPTRTHRERDRSRASRSPSRRSSSRPAWCPPPSR